MGDTPSVEAPRVWSLWNACSRMSGSGASVEVLHELGADLNKDNNNGKQPMHIAASCGQSQCIKVLHRLGADVNKAMNDGYTPARLAEEEGHTECAELIRQLEDMPVNKPEPVFDPKNFK